MLPVGKKLPSCAKVVLARASRLTHRATGTAVRDRPRRRVVLNLCKVEKIPLRTVRAEGRDEFILQ